VLNRASSDDQRLIDESIDLAIRETQTLLDGDINVARKNLHSHKPDEPKNGL
jgi:peptidyl-tRNA hydrolase